MRFAKLKYLISNADADSHERASREMILQDWRQSWYLLWRPEAAELDACIEFQ